MSPEEFERLVAEEAEGAVPEKFRAKLKNVAFLVERYPDEATRQEEGLAEGETLLGLYRGVPHTARGDIYGIGAVMPDTITLYQAPIEEEAKYIMQHKDHTNKLEYVGVSSAAYEECVRQAIRETVWHEVAHHFGMDEHTVREREEGRDTM